MIVYQCNASWPISKRFRRYVKTRVSDKSKRFYDNFHKRRGQSYWWKGYEPVNEEDTNTVQEHM
jgi:hypothetical protein